MSSAPTESYSQSSASLQSPDLPPNGGADIPSPPDQQGYVAQSFLLCDVLDANSMVHVQGTYPTQGAYILRLQPTRRCRVPDVASTVL